jgi:translation elongation factor EF-Ts
MDQSAKLDKIADWLEKQILDSSITDGTIRDKLRLSKSTFYRLKPKAVELVNSRANTRQKAIEDTKTLQAIEAAINGVKTRNERVLNLQRQVDDMQSDLDKNQTVEYVVISGRVQKLVKELSATEKAYIRRSIKSVQAEISKIEGDYAPKKVEDVTNYQVIRPTRK